jgi:Restriction endonuclease
MSLTFPETQAVAELARHLYHYLPGSSYDNRAYTFADAAQEARVPQFWQGGSKEPAIATLLELTLDRQRGSFCPLIEAIVRAGLKYRSRKGNPLTRQDLAELNRLVLAFAFKIPSLWDPAFAATLRDATPAPPVAEAPSHPGKPSITATLAKSLGELLSRFLVLHGMADRQRAGRELERLLHDLFDAFELKPRGAFVVVGEQIDGSIVFDGNSYLVEAKWEEGQVGLAPLMTFREKVSGKSSMTYGIFLSMNGYTDGARDGITRGKQPNFLMLDGRHLYAVLNREVDLVKLLRDLRRELADKGRPYVPLPDVMDIYGA